MRRSIRTLPYQSFEASHALGKQRSIKAVFDPNDAFHLHKPHARAPERIVLWLHGHFQEPMPSNKSLTARLQRQLLLLGRIKRSLFMPTIRHESRLDTPRSYSTCTF
ncbi:hypothetical protein, partial [Pseudomonas viridiflava]|uniref:hypothetical protein n=1 Tax=Pseudomonas viridiflava TaxID=33069 RepID=UPI00197F49C4